MEFFSFSYIFTKKDATVKVPMYADLRDHWGALHRNTGFVVINGSNTRRLRAEYRNREIIIVLNSDPPCGWFGIVCSFRVIFKLLLIISLIDDSIEKPKKNCTSLHDQIMDNHHHHHLLIFSSSSSIVTILALVGNSRRPGEIQGGEIQPPSVRCPNKTCLRHHHH